MLNKNANKVLRGKIPREKVVDVVLVLLILVPLLIIPFISHLLEKASLYIRNRRLKNCGYQLCNKCLGLGFIETVFDPEDISSCEKCKGTGKIYWTEKIRGLTIHE